MRRGILLLLNHELSIGKKKKKRKRRGETRKLEASYRTKLFRAVLLSDRQKFKIGKLGSKKAEREKKKRKERKGKSFFLPPGREIILISVRRVAKLRVSHPSISRRSIRISAIR